MSSCTAIDLKFKLTGKKYYIFKMSNIITVAIVIDPERFKGPLVNFFS